MKILVVGGYTLTLKWHRMDMMKSFYDLGYEVVALGEAPESEWSEFFSSRHIRYRSYYTDRNGTNPIHDLKMLNDLRRIFKEEKPDKVFVYHTKPNVYGSIAARLCGIDEVYAMVGGVGSIFNATGFKAMLVRAILSIEFKAGFSFAKKIFVQNSDDIKLLISKKIIHPDKIVEVDGSGVNTEYYAQQPIPNKLSFLFVGRLVKGKGVIEYLRSAQIVKAKFPEAEFHLVGPFDSNPTSLSMSDLKPYIDKGIIVYHGEQDDVRPYLAACSVFVFPSYYGEGVPKCALEALSTGRAIIVANSTGCREVVVEGRNGFIVEPKSVESLTESMMKMCCAPELIRKFGQASRDYAIERFDVNTIDEKIKNEMEL